MIDKGLRILIQEIINDTTIFTHVPDSIIFSWCLIYNNTYQTKNLFMKK